MTLYGLFSLTVSIIGLMFIIMFLTESAAEAAMTDIPPISQMGALILLIGFPYLILNSIVMIYFGERAKGGKK